MLTLQEAKSIADEMGITDITDEELQDYIILASSMTPAPAEQVDATTEEE